MTTRLLARAMWQLERRECAVAGGTVLARTLLGESLCFSRLFGVAATERAERMQPRKTTPLRDRRFVDHLRVKVRGGDGGSGCTSFRKSRHARHGFADGGNGGRGGEVVIVATDKMWDLANVKQHQHAGCGRRGGAKRVVGRHGEDRIVQVPVGTVVRLLEGSLTHPEPEEEFSFPEPNDIRGGAEHTHEEAAANAEASESDDNMHSNAVRYAGTDLQSESSSGEETISGDTVSEGSDRDDWGGADMETVVLHKDEDGRESVQSAMEIDGRESSGQVIDLERREAENEDEDDGFWDEENSSDDESDDEGEGEDTWHWQRKRAVVVADLVKAGERVVVARGGVGGRGNASMPRGRGPDRALPSREHETGTKGSAALLVLELKTVADVGLVGFPNAGKSTLLAALSRAKPKIGSYAFTTLRPHVGTVKIEGGSAFTVADIPGLIEGAHANRGLGHAFLRHIERTKVLAYVVDLAGGLEEDDVGLRPWEQLSLLMSELDAYEPGLSERPAIVVANKVDEDGAEHALAVLKTQTHLPVWAVCAVLGEGIHDLKLQLQQLVTTERSRHKGQWTLDEGIPDESKLCHVTLTHESNWESDAAPLNHNSS